MITMPSVEVQLREFHSQCGEYQAMRNETLMAAQ